MDAPLSTQEQQLCQFLAELPARFDFRYTEDASKELLRNLFWSMAGGNHGYMGLLFPTGRLADSLKLREAQGMVDGAEYTEAARGKRCGHIFKPGEASYSCRTCATDETCCLCSRCFDSTDHSGHMVRMSLSVGNSGCCDCGDDEAWKHAMLCAIHSDIDTGPDKGKAKQAAALPDEFLASLRMTVARAFDYICDVVSCSPEQLRQAKSQESILKDEESSRLSSKYYGAHGPPCTEFALVLWNDEKHTVQDVQDQVARACRKTIHEAARNAQETDLVGRSILTYSTDIPQLLRMARIMEAIRVTMTIRAARDTFREQMCGTLVEWLSDISACTAGHDAHILRQTVCEQAMRPWRQGSRATHTLGLIDDEEEDDRSSVVHRVNANIIMALQRDGATANVEIAIETGAVITGDDDDGDDDDDEIDEVEHDDDQVEGDDDAEMDDGEDGNHSVSSSAAVLDEDQDVMMVDARGDVTDLGMNWSQSDQALEEDEATMAGYPRPPPPPPPPAQTRGGARERDGTPSDSDTADGLIAPAMSAKANAKIPKTPGKTTLLTPRPARYWVETPQGYTQRGNVPPAEDVFQRVRLDWLLCFDLRLWKRVRINLRSLYISTVVQIPEFKRVLALRFASLYTVLAQLYLVGDREPDHSVINLSLQMLTTPSITAEIVERGNFMSSLFAILYTFLTTRQVGHPWDVSPEAVVAFESGTVTNRRTFHFYQDFRFLVASPHVQERIRCEPRYLMQFLDLTKLHQGMGPNVRAVAEHVEYEPDSWITTTTVTRQMSLQARNVAEAFRNCPADELHYLQRAIRFTAKTVIINSVGAERHRFKQAEINDEVKFKTLSDFEFDSGATSYQVVKFVVDRESISFHHALHYTLSWLIECARGLPASSLRTLMSFNLQELKSPPRLMGRPQLPKKEYEPEDYLMAAFDFPLRVCVLLAQIKASMWVRNGLSLRHQANTYRGVVQREVMHSRDIFLLQTAMVVCNPSRVLASIVDRFGMDGWVKGIFELKSEAQDDVQHLDIVEDMMHLLIVLVSDRISLMTPEDEANSLVLAMRRDIIHVLCFKPLSFTEICNKLPEKHQEHQEFYTMLDELATFKPPEGMSDVGTFELRPEFIEDIDPYISHYNKNQREESELAYRRKMAKKTGKTVDEIVYEPRQRPSPSGLFQRLGEFTSTGVFAQIIYYSLLYPLVAHKLTATVPVTRLEGFVQVVLHLMLIAIVEDKTDEAAQTQVEQGSFVYTVLTKMARSNFMPEASNSRSIVSLLHLLSTRQEFKSAHGKIALVLKRLKQKRPQAFETAFGSLGIAADGISTASPANTSGEEERERKKRAALSRQAKVMAQFQQQQKNFLENQGAMDWGSDVDEDDEAKQQQTEERGHDWKFPRGTCILCQEEVDDQLLYGTFALLAESRMLRQTDFQDASLVREASQTPCSLDRSADEVRPFGMAQENRKTVAKMNGRGERFLAERQTIGKGYAGDLSRPGPLASGCGHMMHYHCFEVYYEATNSRHTQQIARHHPETMALNEFVCPLCKARGNVFLPIIWRGMQESYPGRLQARMSFADFFEHQIAMDKWQGQGPGAAESLAAAASTMMDGLTAPRTAPLSPWDRLLSVAPPVTSSASLSLPIGRDGSRGVDGADLSMNIMDELENAYTRLKESVRLNKLDKRYDEAQVGDGGELDLTEMLVYTVAFTLSSAELQQRGVEAQPGMTLLERIPEQTITQLRVLAETASALITMRGRFGNFDNPMGERRFRQCCQLFITRHLGMEPHKLRRLMNLHPPLLSLDPFIFLVECTYGLGSVPSFDVTHLVSLCYLAELVKVVYHMSRNMNMSKWLEALQQRQSHDEAINNFADFALAVTEYGMCDDESAGHAHAQRANEAFDQPGVDTLQAWYSFVKKYALVFLRKSLLLLYIKYGIDFNSFVSLNPEADELHRLTEAMMLPSFDQMCASLTSKSSACGWPETIRDVVLGWVKHQVLGSNKPSQVPQTAIVSHPGIFELIGLPKTYDTLIEEASRRTCPTTGKDVSDPVICLFCGEIVCSQSTCCQKLCKVGNESVKLGGGQQHMRRCQRNIGVFLNIRKCTMIFFFNQSGSFQAAPYMDRYGETDYQLRHGRQLFLSQRRYDSMIRSTVLNNDVPTLISRRLEPDVNNGGWDTL
ncbi:hypothetical protein CDD82_5813 [Ophiocordyceps australis]|uniref:E3 ubiquitin-protein ligase n=1 Tax=Ophiocordyceps australis TaxID=1399860 RepID=A0A2C5Y3T2_9HYPO|nr:hypothetical protein CDD82_5813 [Ophiocordyceps australis]